MCLANAFEEGSQRPAVVLRNRILLACSSGFLGAGLQMHALQASESQFWQNKELF